MRLRTLAIATLILVVAPLSLTWLIGLFWKPLYAFASVFLLELFKMQVAVLLFLSPIIAATKLWEWAKRRGFI